MQVNDGRPKKRPVSMEKKQKRTIDTGRFLDARHALAFLRGGSLNSKLDHF